MGLGFAAVWSVLSKKTRKSKLKVLKEKLEKQQKQQAILHQYPTKLLFSLLFLLLVSIYLEYFFFQLSKQLTEKAKVQAENSLGFIHSFDQTKSNQFQENQKEQNEINSYSNTNQIIQRTSRTINIIHLFAYLATASILYNLSYKRISAKKGQSSICRTTYELLGFKKKIEYYPVSEGDRLQIWEMGQTRFTNTNYYYSIRIIGKNENWEIIKKSNIYFSRTSIIELSFILNIPYSIKILKVPYDQKQP